MTRREFELHFRNLYLPLGMYGLRITGNVEAAEDAVQEAFAKAWLAVDAGREIGQFRSYMYQIVRNECISWLRRQKETVGLENVPEVDDEAVDTSVRDARLWKAVDGLPERCREVFLLSKRDGLTNEEIADELNISIKTVKNQMTKAFSRLRDALSSNHKPFFLPFL